MTAEKTLTRIAALLRQAEGTDNAHEADAFLTAAQRMATAASIDLAVARAHAADRERRTQPIQKKVQIGAPGTRGLRTYVELFLAISHANDVTCDIASNSSAVYCFGFPDDIAVCEALYASLAVQMVRASDAYIKSGSYRAEVIARPVRRYDFWGEPTVTWEEKPVRAVTARVNFQQAYARRIEARLQEARSAARADVIKRDGARRLTPPRPSWCSAARKSSFETSTAPAREPAVGGRAQACRLGTPPTPGGRAIVRRGRRGWPPRGRSAAPGRRSGTGYRCDCPRRPAWPTVRGGAACGRVLDRTQTAGVRTVDFHGSTLTLSAERRFASVESMQAYIDLLLGLRWVGASWPRRAGIPVTVRARRGQACAHYERGTATIAVPPYAGNRAWAMRELVLLHELAHHLAAEADSPPHGAAFAERFVHLVTEVMGPETGLLLRSAMHDSGVRLQVTAGVSF